MVRRGRHDDGDGSPGANGRKRRGDYPTPPWLVELVVEQVVDELLATRHGGTIDEPLRVLDPACGDGRFLAAVARHPRLADRIVEVRGIDIDPNAVAAATAVLAAVPGVVVDVTVGDALATTWSSTFDVVVGNPPFLSQLAAATSRGGASRRGGGPYADTAAEFLDLAVDATRPGGVVGLVLPQSALSSRDVAAIRQRVDAECERRWSWWSPAQVFDAAVVVCALVLRRRTEPVVADRSGDPPASWADVVTTQLGIPALPKLAAAGTLGQRLVAGADFRDVYYGIAAAVTDVDSADPPLVTSGLIDPLQLLWGQRPTRVAKRRFENPRVSLAALSPPLRKWADGQLVAKLLVANQSRRIEVVVDEGGELLPAVPVLSVRPRRADDGSDDVLWQAAAVLSSPAATAWAWQRQAGTGLSGTAIRLTPATISELPWPAGALDDAGAALRAGAVDDATAAVHEAFGIGVDHHRRLTDWWLHWTARGAIGPGRGQTQRT